jgi:hypothetical protein
LLVHARTKLDMKIGLSWKPVNPRFPDRTGPLASGTVAEVLS